MRIHYTHFESPLGKMLAVSTYNAITDLHVVTGKYVPTVRTDWIHTPQQPILQQLQTQLSEYFAGTRTSFTVKLEPQGTDFQKAAWHALTKIPYGETRTYGEQAAAIGNPSAVRAIGAANGRNPIAIVIPCHRIIGANGTLTGYAGGLDKKEFLLKLEGALRSSKRSSAQ